MARGSLTSATHNRHEYVPYHLSLASLGRESISALHALDPVRLGIHFELVRSNVYYWYLQQVMQRCFAQVPKHVAVEHRACDCTTYPYRLHPGLLSPHLLSLLRPCCVLRGPCLSEHF